MAGARHQNVMPGDVITTGPYRPEEHTVLDGKRILATAVGVSEIRDDSVRVVPLAGMYYPRVKDFVIGKVVSHTSLSWELEINSCYVGFLPASDVFGRDFSAHADDLTSHLAKGDMVAARVANFDRTRDPLLTVQDRDLGKIDIGELASLAPGKVPHLIGKNGSTIRAIEESCRATLAVGDNGWVVITADDPDGLLKAERAVRMIDEGAHEAGISERVRSMLETG